MRPSTAARIAGAAWAATALAVLATVVFIWLSRDAPAPYVVPFRGFEGVLAMAFVSAGAPVAARRPSQPIGWLFIALGISFGLQAAGLQYAHLALVGRPEPLAGGVVAAWAQEVVALAFSGGIFALILLLFPTGRLLSPRWRVLAVIAVSSGVLEGLGAAFKPGPILTFRIVSNPYAATGGAEDVVSVVTSLGNAFFVVAVLGSAVSLFVRFRRAGDEERHQLKWLLPAGLLVAVGVAAYAAAGPEAAASPAGRPIHILLAVAIAGVPVAAAVAILRYRLYDIDRIISRTLSYGLMTVVLAGVYAAVVLAPMALVGGGNTPEWLIALGTLSAAALFRPLRRRTQSSVDRRFNRARFDADHEVMEFARRLESHFDPDDIGKELVSAARRTLEPSRVWLEVFPARNDPGTPGGLTSFGQSPREGADA